MDSDVKSLAECYSLEQLIDLWKEARQADKQLYKDAMKLSLLMEIAEALLD